jgi:hypothetical protein
MNVYETGGLAPVSLTLELNGGELTAPFPGCFYTWKEPLIPLE